MNIDEMIYAGELLSDYGLVISGFDSRSGEETITTDSQRTFNSVSMFNGKYHPFVSTIYEDALIMEFGVIKNECWYVNQYDTESFDTIYGLITSADDGWNHYIPLRLEEDPVVDDDGYIKDFEINLSIQGDAQYMKLGDTYDYATVKAFLEEKYSYTDLTEDTMVAVFTVYDEEAHQSGFDNITVKYMTEDRGEYNSEFTLEELRKIKRWLNRSIPHMLQFPTISGFEDVFWMGSFNVEEIYIGGMPCGLHLTFTSTRPFGLRTETYLSGSLDVGEELTITDGSDDEGHIYPFMYITCDDGGDFELSITNSGKTRKTVVKNCTSGETLTFSPLLQVVSSVESHELGDDFNYIFPRIANNYYDDTRDNVISSSVPIHYQIRYNEIVKAVIA